MADYRTKPITVDAVQWDGTAEHARTLGLIEHTGHARTLYILELPGEGEGVVMESGDWVVTEPDGITQSRVINADLSAKYDPVILPL